MEAAEAVVLSSTKLTYEAAARQVGLHPSKATNVGAYVREWRKTGKADAMRAAHRQQQVALKAPEEVRWQHAPSGIFFAELLECQSSPGLTL